MMSFENKGSLASTIVVSLSPDLTGNYVCNGAADEVEINLALAEANRRGGGRVLLLQGDYVLAAPIVFPGNELVLQGMRRATFIDGDALETGNHGIVISGRTDCVVRDLSIQTQDGGTKTCHCVFIEDGSDRFTVENVVIVDSDDEGIHVEGTTIDTGHILNCEVLGADGNGVLVDMDGGNFMYRLHIEGCDVGNCGQAGINLVASGGNLYCAIVNNICYSNGSNGIEYVDGGYSTVGGNICISNGQMGMVLQRVVHTQVIGNACYLNTRHGMICFGADSCTMEGNTYIDNDSGDTATYDGINLDLNSADNVVNGNICDGNDRNGIQSEGDRNNITDNQCTNNGDYGIEITATADANKVKDNKFNGNTVGAFLDGGTSTQLPMVWVEIWDDTHAQVSKSAIGEYMCLLMASNQDCDFRFNIPIPSEFQQLVTAWVEIISDNANPTIRWSADVDMAGCGEIYTVRTDTIGINDHNFTQNQKECLDVSGGLTPIVALDTVGFEFVRNGAHANDDAGNVRVLGCRLRYV